MKRLTAVLFALALVIPGLAQAENGVFLDYGNLREQLDPLMKQRKISEVLVLFGGSSEMSDEQLAELDRRVQSIYAQDFTDVALVQRKDMLNGWRQEILAFWTGTSYTYVYLLLHDRGQRMLSINFKFNSDFHELMKNF